MPVSSLFTDRIEFVKKKHAVSNANLVEKTGEAKGRFPKVAPYHRLIPHDHQGDG